MNTKRISEQALSIIDQYQNFRVGSAVCSVPYFNNRTTARRAGLKVEIGKGSPKDIFEEVHQLSIQQKIPVENMDSAALKTFLTDNNIGIDCSAFAYYVLNEESIARGKGALDKHLAFPLSTGFLGKIKAKMRPVENTNVESLAHEKNSRVIPLAELEPGDMITMLGGPDGGERNHILVITQIEYQNFKPISLHYMHAIAWPADGQYGHGIHSGTIEITKPDAPIIEQRWIENSLEGQENYTWSRAKNSQTELRRLAFL